MMNGGPIPGKSSCQDNVFFVYLRIWIRCFKPSRSRGPSISETLKDFGYQRNTADEIYEDNLTFKDASKILMHLKFSRHIDICSYFMREFVKAIF